MSKDASSNGGPAPHTLPALLKKRLIDDMIRSVDPPSKWKIMVVDAKSLKIMSAVLRVFDILEENVTLVENLSRNRQAYPQLEAIYFLAPEEDSVDRFTRDFETRPLYAAAHLFFSNVTNTVIVVYWGVYGVKFACLVSSRYSLACLLLAGNSLLAVARLLVACRSPARCPALSDRLFNRLKSTNAARYIKTCKELFVDYITFDSHSFTLDSPQTFHRILSPTSQPSTQTLELASIAKRIVSVMATMGEYPHVRWWDGPTTAKVGGESATSLLARMVQQEIDDLCRLDPDFPPSSPYQRATLIIVDRTIDSVAPLLHEFTYQAMINDLLPVQDGNKYTYTTAEGAVVSVSLDETDPLFVKIRHSHIADTINITISKFNEFVGGNAAAKSALGGGNNGVKPGAAASIKDMKATLAALPQFQELKTKFAAHINLCQECMGLFERRKLGGVGGVEQDMGTGRTVEGETVKGVMVEMVPLLDDQYVGNLDKLRLLMLYLISRDGISDEERRKLVQSARLSPEEAESLTNLSFLGHRLTPGPNSKAVPDPRRAYVGSSVTGKLTKKKGGQKEQEEEDRPYDLSRYVPTLKYIMEDECRGVLDTDLFPYTKELPPDAPGGPMYSKNNVTVGGGRQVKLASADPDRHKVVSLRSTKPTWATKTPQLLAQMQAAALETDPIKRAQEGEREEDLRRNGGRVVVFVLGGMTFSELRSAYEVMKKERRDVTVGTDCIITPTDFVHNIRDLRNPAGSNLGMMQDASALESAIHSAAASAMGGSSSLGVPGGSSAAPSPNPSVGTLDSTGIAPVFGSMSVSGETTPTSSSMSRSPQMMPQKTMDGNRQGTMDELSGGKKKGGLFGKLKFGK